MGTYTTKGSTFYISTFLHRTYFDFRQEWQITAQYRWSQEKMHFISETKILKMN